MTGHPHAAARGGRAAPRLCADPAESGASRNGNPQRCVSCAQTARRLSYCASLRVAADERLRREIWESAAFDGMRRRYGAAAAEERFFNTVHGVAGELRAGQPVLSNDADAERVRAECELTVHCAASISFDAPLRDALAQNVHGALQMFELAGLLSIII